MCKQHLFIFILSTPRASTLINLTLYVIKNNLNHEESMRCTVNSSSGAKWISPNTEAVTGGRCVGKCWYVGKSAKGVCCCNDWKPWTLKGEDGTVGGTIQLPFSASILQFWYGCHLGPKWAPRLCAAPEDDWGPARTLSALSSSCICGFGTRSSPAWTWGVAGARAALVLERTGTAADESVSPVHTSEPWRITRDASSAFHALYPLIARLVRRSLMKPRDCSRLTLKKKHN